MTMSRAGRMLLGATRMIVVIMFICSGLCCQQGQKVATPGQASTIRDRAAGRPR